MGTHWSVRTLAKHLGVGTMVVHSVLAAEAIQPHRFRYWKHSNDPEFEPTMLMVVGLYLAPPQNAVVLSVDEKTSIQALDRTQPRLPTIRRNNSDTFIRFLRRLLQAYPDGGTVRHCGQWLLAYQQENARQGGLPETVAPGLYGW